MTFPNPSTPDVEQTVQRLKDLSNQAIDASKQSGRTWLDAYEQLLNSFLKMQSQAAQTSQLEWVTNLANTNADFVRDMSTAYLSAVREQLK